jgi:hypothetical protein
MSQGFARPGAGASLTDTSFWGLQVDPDTSKMTLVNFVTGSNTPIRLQDYQAFLFETNNVTFTWDTTYPANLVLGVS